MSGWREEAARLPIGEALPALAQALARHPCAVLVAPPGAGKTTVTPLALLDQPWAHDGKIIVLEPRRLAARAAAARMAALLGETVGGAVGYRVRLESRVSASTRIEVVTEGVFTRTILDDPGLEGVVAVIFDEFHERSLDADLGLALARDSQTLLREDLRLLVMSATLDGARIAQALNNAPVVESRGRMFEVETRYLGRDPRAPIEPQMVRAVLRGLDAGDGGVLAFLPGQGEIVRTAEQLMEALGSRPVEVIPLYGALDLAAQDRALATSSPGRRKVVLATAIAQTSLTLPDIRVVVDSGLARAPRFDAGAGVTRLATTPVSRASADQRRGRAGRTAPGLCLRLWDEAQTRGLPPFDEPEILQADLSRLALDLARWGAVDASQLTFLDPPPVAAFGEARRLLQRLGALDEGGALNRHGAAIARLPLPPRLAHMIIRGAGQGVAGRAALLAAVISERGLGGGSADLSERADGLLRDGSPRARAARRLAERWAELAGPEPRTKGRLDDGALVAEAYPERLARRRDAPGEFQLASGRGALVDQTSALARHDWLAVAELTGLGSRDRIVSATPLDFTAWRAANPDQVSLDQRLTRSPSGSLRTQRLLRVGAIIVETREGDPSPELIEAALLEEVARDGIGALPWSEASQSFRARISFLRRSDQTWPDVSDEALAADCSEWLAPVLIGVSSLGAIEPARLHAALLERLSWSLRQRLDLDAPSSWVAPTGTAAPIDYTAEPGPMVQVRVQELFGLAHHPSVGGAPLILTLLSPARRPIQVTADLPGFWAGSWGEVRREMRGRYPRHPWPEDPLATAPTRRAKPRGT